MGLMFTAFGLWSLFDPVGMTSQLNVIVGGPNGSFEIRGIFGGVSLGGALLCLGAAFKTGLIRPALWFLMAYMGGYCIARAASVALGDLPTPETWAFVGFEAVSALLAAICLWREGRKA